MSTFLVAILKVVLFLFYFFFDGWHSRDADDLAATILGIGAGFLVVFSDYGVYIASSAFLVSLVIVFFKRWSLAAVGAILAEVVVCSSVCSFLIDPLQSRWQMGWPEYLTGLVWFTCAFNRIAIVTGFAASLIAFWALQRVRSRRSSRRA
ncbi:MAG TPA: hypothetical protein VGR14_11770 [Verrucomicrobiae bacterium]|nr:hypothetical protein [Verrucomicrobiae bacterium]